MIALFCTATIKELSIRGNCFEIVISFAKAAKFLTQRGISLVLLFELPLECENQCAFL